MSAYSDTYTALQRQITGMRLKIFEQLADTSLTAISVSDIDALELSLEQNVRRPLRSLRNSRLACNGIPPEVVTRIAHYCSSPTFDTAWYFCLLKSTHFCHRWREIIISCPSLWTLIHMQPPKLASMFLERSRDLPLKIYTLSDFCFEPVHLRRIKTLRLRTSDLDGLSEIFSRLTIPSPVITEVIIDVTSWSDRHFPDLPPLFGDMSTIKSLSLDALNFDIKLLSFTSLTSLTMSLPGVLLSPFFDLLAVNPALESVSISVWGAIQIPAGQIDAPIIPLNNLVTLHCRDTSRLLLSRLSLPPSTTIQIECMDPPLTLSNILPSSVANIRSLAQINTVCLATTTGVVYTGRTTDTHHVQLAGSGGLMDIHWVSGYDGPRKFDPHPLSLDYVKELSITHKTTPERPRASELDFSPLFKAMKRLEALRIHLCLPSDCDPILSPFDDNRICPSLHTVEIFHRSRQTQWLSALLHVATRRRKAGLALRQVLVSPHPGVDSLVQSYIKDFDGVLLEPSEANDV